MTHATKISNLLDMQVSQMSKQQGSQGMKQESNANGLRTNCKTQQSNVEVFSEIAVIRVFQRLTVMHGRAFTSINGRSATDEAGKLTLAAETWQLCLTGVTYEQVTGGLSKLATTDEYDNYSITAKQFRTLCLSVGKSDIPSIEQVVKILAVSVPQKGTVAKRFQHPLVLAIAKDEFFDSYLSRTGSTAQCIAMVKPIYNRVIKANIPEFNDIDYHELAVIAVPSKTTKSVAMAALAAIKTGGFVTDEKPSNAKQVTDCVDFKVVSVPTETEDEILKRLSTAQPTQKEIELKERVMRLKINSDVNVSDDNKNALNANFEGVA